LIVKLIKVTNYIKINKIDRKMSYEKLTIKQMIEKIGNNEIYLPAIQRKFVWKQEQTEKLFD